MKELRKNREILVAKDEMLRKLGFKVDKVDNITIENYDMSTFKVTLICDIDKEMDE